MTAEVPPGSLLESERSARQAAELSAERMRRLARAASFLSKAVTAKEVATVIVEEAMTAIGAQSSGVWLLDADGRQLEVLAHRGMVAGMEKYIGCYPVDTPNPLCAAVRTGMPVWIDSWETFARLFPHSEARVRHFPPPRPQSFASLPMRFENRIIGGLAFTFLEDRHLDEEDRSFIALMAEHCAQGLERARLYEQALEAVRMRDDFLSIAGHELRTPLSTLHMQVQLLLDDKSLSAVTTNAAHQVLRTTQRLLGLADELLDVSRIRAGRLRLERERMELGALVRKVATRTVEEQRHRPELRFDCPLRIEGSWDPLRLELIIANLVTNACKYGGGRPVDVVVKRGSRGAEVLVRDQGGGIPLAEQARIFGRFERGSSSSDFAGLGLGLWIAREIAQAHGGEIRVRSEPGQGAEFTLTLPVAEPV